MTQPLQARRSGIPQAQPILAPNWFLGLVPREYWNVEKSFFIYEQDFLPLGISATAVGNVQIQQDSHFLCIAAVAIVVDTTNTNLINSEANSIASGKLVLITDVGSGMPLSNVPVPLENIAGTGRQPAIWPIPKLFRAGGTISTQIQNLIATAHNVRISYWGMRIYYQLALGSK